MPGRQNLEELEKSWEYADDGYESLDQIQRERAHKKGFREGVGRGVAAGILFGLLLAIFLRWMAS